MNRTREPRFSRAYVYVRGSQVRAPAATATLDTLRSRFANVMWIDGYVMCDGPIDPRAPVSRSEIWRPLAD